MATQVQPIAEALAAAGPRGLDVDAVTTLLECRRIATAGMTPLFCCVRSRGRRSNYAPLGEGGGRKHG